MKAYDYLIVGAGLFGSVFAYEAGQRGKTCLVVEKRAQVGGNCFCRDWDGIPVQEYGAHIFHTDSREIWDYVNAAAAFQPYVHNVIANYQGELYSLPFNMHTFHALWGVVTPEEARAKLEQVRVTDHASANLETKALALVGPEIYEKLIRHYTEKQWGRPCTDLPAFIIERLPLRFTYNNNYFNDPFQGMPQRSYNELFDFWLAKASLRLNCDFLSERAVLSDLAEKILFTGALDAYFDYRYGALEYRSLRFEHERFPLANVQGCAVMNYTDGATPFTRIIEHRHFYAGLSRQNAAAPAHSVMTREYPQAWTVGQEAYYPINNTANNALHQRYLALAEAEPKLLLGGRLADYRYYDMDDTIAMALALVRREFGD